MGCENFGYGCLFNLISQTQKDDTGEILPESPI